MKQIILYIICFFVGAGSVIGVRYYLTQSSRPFLTDAPFFINAPSQALVGRVSGTGTIKLQSPHDAAFREITSETSIKQLDALFIEKGEGTVTIGETMISMEEGSELFFEHLILPNMFVRQRSGVVTYETKTPWSVRAQRSLVTLEKGTMEISIDGMTATINVKEGDVHIGNIDEDNNTTTYTLSKGDRAVVNGTLQTVVIR